MGFRLLRRLLYLVRQRQMDADLAEELAFHREMKQRELEGEGMRSDAAAAASQRALGNATLAREDARAVWIWRWIDDCWRDVTYASRGFRRNPSFTMVAVLTLATGIGANTAMYSLIHGVLLRPLGYRDPEALISVARGELGAVQNRAVSLQRVEALVRSAKSFTGIGAYLVPLEDVTVSIGSGPEVLKGARVSANFLDVLGVQPEAGRTFVRDEDASGAPPVVMVSARLWNRRFGGEQLPGQPVRINSEPYTIVGVLPESFRFPHQSVDVWFPQPARMSSLAPQFHACCAPLRVFARLKPGVSLDEARAELAVLDAQYAAALPKAVDAGALSAALLKDDLTASVNVMLWVLLAAVGFVLLIACADVAMLLMARATSRAREFAVRTALGATRRQLFRQFTVESLVLSAGGGLAGLVLAYVVLLIVRQMTLVDLPRANEIVLDRVILGFTGALSLAAAVLFGTLPSLRILGRDVAQALRQGGACDASTSTSRAAAFISSPGPLLVVLQVTLSIVLLVGAGLMIKTLTRLSGVDAGFRADGLLTMRVPLPTARYDTPASRTRFFDELIGRLADIPGVQMATVSRSLPTTPGFLGTNLQIDDERIPEPGQVGLRLQTVSPRYFRVLEIPFRRGRDLIASDNVEGAAPVAVINESFARRFWPTYPDGPDPVGRRLRVPILRVGPIEIVGIVADVREAGLTRDTTPQFYVPNVLYPPQVGYVALRVERDSLSIARAVAAVAREIDSDQSVSDVRMMTEILKASEGQRHFSARLLTLFAATALLLALVGIYGVLAYSVAQRTSEIGIRRALGARSADIAGLVLKQALGLSVVGVVCGVWAATALTRVLGTLLFEVTPTEPSVYAGVAVLFVVIALAAGLVPVWRAVRISPNVAIRT